MWTICRNTGTDIKKKKKKVLKNINNCTDKFEPDLIRELCALVGGWGGAPVTSPVYHGVCAGTQPAVVCSGLGRLPGRTGRGHQEVPGRCAVRTEPGPRQLLRRLHAVSRKSDWLVKISWGTAKSDVLKNDPLYLPSLPPVNTIACSSWIFLAVNQTLRLWFYIAMIWM